MSDSPPLDVDRIEAARKDARLGRKVVLFGATGSTNDIAWEYARNPVNDGLCVLAEAQTAGRGRRGRTWFSEPGQSILCSVLLTKTDIEAELLTLTAAVAAAEAVNAFCTLACRIKWPNDILIQNQKVAGILVEKRVQNTRNSCVIGIGINCNQRRDAFDRYSLNTPATSLAIETGHDIDRTALICEFLKHLEIWLDNPGADTKKLSPCQGGVPPRGEGVKARTDYGSGNYPILDRWLQLSDMLGRHITLECDGRQYSGFCRGIDPVQGLILQLDNSLVRMFSAAHTSIVPSSNF